MSCSVVAWPLTVTVTVKSVCRFVAEPNVFGESSDARGHEHDNPERDIRGNSSRP